MNSSIKLLPCPLIFICVVLQSLNQTAIYEDYLYVKFCHVLCYQGIDFDDFGHPDFFNSSSCPGHEYCLKTSDLQGHPTGGLPTDLKPDFNLANQNLMNSGKAINVLHSSGSLILIKIDGKWEGTFTWHHHQDGKTIMPVKQGVHNLLSHTGGDSAIRKDIKGFFDSPF